jgi:hypothetical protein
MKCTRSNTVLYPAQDKTMFIMRKDGKAHCALCGKAVRLRSLFGNVAYEVIPNHHKPA